MELCIRRVVFKMISSFLTGATSSTGPTNQVRLLQNCGLTFEEPFVNLIEPDPAFVLAFVLF